MDTTPDLGLPELAQGQANPDVTVNNKTRLIQALLNGVIDRAINAPPVSPSEQDSYIVGAAPTGAWAGRANHIAVFIGGLWQFVPGNDSAGTPIAMGARQEGMSVYVRDEDRRYTWRGTGSPAAFAWGSGEVNTGNVIFTNTDRLLGRDTAGGGAGEEITVSGGLEFTGAGGIQTSAFTGDVTKAAGGTSLSIASNSLALAKLVNAAAQYDLIARKSASAGAWEDCTRSDLSLARTDTGQTLTGTQTINGAALTALKLTQSTTGLTQTDSVLVVESTDGGASGPTVTYYHNSASPAANDLSRLMRFAFNNATPAVAIFTVMAVQVDVTTAGAESTTITFSNRRAGTNRTVLTFADTATLTLNTLINVGTGTVDTPSNTIFQSRADGLNRSVFDSYGSVPFFQFRRAGGTGSSPTATAANEQIGQFGANGYYVTGGPGFPNANTCSVNFFAAENYTSTALGSYIQFSTTPVGSTSLTNRFQLNADGSLMAAGLSATGVAGTFNVNRYYRLGVALNSQTTVATDADFTLQIGTSSVSTRHTGSLTTNRTVTLSTTNAQQGDEFEITRTGSGASNLSIGGLKNLATNTWARVRYDGSAWYLAAYGAL